MGRGNSPARAADRGSSRIAFEANALVDLAHDQVQEIQGMIRFGKELLDVHGVQFRDVIVEDRGAANDDWLHGLLKFNSAADFDAGKHGQVQVEQDQVERPSAREVPDSLKTIGRFDDLEVLPTEELGDQTPQGVFVLDQ